MSILRWQVEGFVEGFVGVLSAQYCLILNTFDYILRLNGYPENSIVDRRKLEF